MRWPLCLGLFGLALTLAEAKANPVPCDLCTVSPCDETGVVLVCPDYRGGAADPVEGVAIHVNVRNENGDPIFNAFVEILFENPSDLCPCTDLASTGWTDASGEVDFNLSAGGCALGSHVVWVRVMDFPIRAYDAVKSPDVDGDCRVALPDFINFAAAYESGAAGCTDYYNDGVTDLNDFILFGQSWGHECP